MTPEVGIRAQYPHLPASTRLKAYLACARPFTWLAPIVGVVAAAFMAVNYGRVSWHTVTSDWRTLVYGAATLLMVVVGNNFVNQATDPEDEVNRAYRPIVRGLIAREEASTVGHLLWFFALLRAATLGVSFGVLVLILVSISYAYSHPPLRFKARPWFGNIGIGIARGGVGFMAAWSLWAPLWAPEVWAAAIILTLFLVGGTTAKDFADEVGDRQFGVQTLVVRYGPSTAALWSIPFILTPIPLLLLFRGLGVLRTPFYAIVVLTLVLVTFVEAMLNRQRDRNSVLEGTRPWTLMYVSLLVLQLVLAVTA